MGRTQKEDSADFMLTTGTPLSPRDRKDRQKLCSSTFSSLLRRKKIFITSVVCFSKTKGG